MKGQKGFTLIVGMVMLVLITLMLLYLFRDTVLQERMAGNAVGRLRALQAAETALRDGESLIQNRQTSGNLNAPFDPFRLAGFTTNCTNGFCLSVPVNPSSLLDNGLQSSSYNAQAITDNRLGQAPRYVIELITEPQPSGPVGCTVGVYRVLAKGWGSSGSSVMAQSHFAHRPRDCR